MVVGYPSSSSPTVGPCSQGPLKYTWVRDNQRYLVAVCLEGTSKATAGVFTAVHGSEGLRVVPYLPCTQQPAVRSTFCAVLFSTLTAMYLVQ